MTWWAKALVGLLIAAAFAALGFTVLHALEALEDRTLAKGAVLGAAPVQARFDAYRIAAERARSAAVQDALRDYMKAATATNEGERRAREKAERQAAAERDARDAANAAGDRLLGAIARLNAAASAAGAPDAASCPGELVRERAAAVRARNLFGACTAAYRDMGERADRSFTRLDLKLDVALSYIQAVQAPDATGLQPAGP